MSMKRLQRMPGASFERPRACKLTDIEPQTIKGPGGCNSSISSHAGSVGNGSGGPSGNIDDSASRLGSIARFPKLDECAHFHYEHVELGNIEVSISNDEQSEEQSKSFAVRVTSGDACWTLQRTYENLVMFDEQLHRCIFDRQFSQLVDLQNLELSEEDKPKLPSILKEYMQRFSNLGHEGLNCGPVLNWLQLDNRGRRILVPESDSCPINTPAVAAAYAVRPYQAQAQDELSFQVGDMISVIDMPPAGESSWWRGKHGFAVGFFPAECVAVIGDKLPRHLAATVPPAAGAGVRVHTGYTGPPRLQPVKPVLRKHGKLIAFFRSFILNRPSRRRLKQSGILRERVFGCDLGEHLLNSGHEVPSVLSCCAEFIERHGLVDGIYRLSGVTSNIQRLRHAFDEDRVPALHSDEGILQDIHSVASLLKMYFRELPNPLCTYQLYSSFVSAVQSASDSERLRKMKEAVRKLPPPHYRTLEYLMRHLVRVAARGEETGMTPRNVAIVWAPNLLRCKELEVGGVAALQGVGVQAVVTEFLICYAELIFSSGPNEPSSSSPTGASAGSPSSPGAPSMNQHQQRPKSLAIATNSARLLSLEEARNRSLAPEPELIEVGAGSAGLPLHYHTVIELPAQLQRQQSGSQRKRNGSKRSPSLNWRALFGGRQSSKGRSQSKQLQAIASPSLPLTAPVPKLDELSAAAGGSLRRLRPVKSADSLDGTTEDGLAPLILGPSGQRTCGHSRSVSHDSYFEQLGGEQPSTAGSVPSATSVASALDLSEIQLSFELEEREMRMLEEAGSGRSRQSLEASPRRQRPKELSGGSSFVDTGLESETSSTIGVGPLICSKPSAGGGSGGSKRKRSRLEERLQCDVELRFIDSQSPDQVMVSVDVHEMESPSPLPTPGYLPLLSEGSTPLSPATTTATVSPRISFKSFALPLDLDERVIENVKPCPTKTVKEPNTSLRLDYNVERLKQNSGMEYAERPTELSSSFTGMQQKHLIDDAPFETTTLVDLDHEMTSYEPLIDLNTPIETAYHGLNISQNLPISSNNEEEKSKISKTTFNESDTVSEETQDQVSCVLDSNLSDLTNSDSLMPLQQDCTSYSNFEIGIDRDSKVVTPGLSSYLSDLSTDSVITTFDQANDNQLQNLSDTNDTVEQNQSSLNSSGNNCQESMCYSVSNGAFDIELTSQPAQSSFYSTSKNDSCMVESKDSNLIDDKPQSLVKLETNSLLSQFNSKTNESDSQSSLCQLTCSKNEVTFCNKQHVKDEIPKWNTLQNDECKVDKLKKFIDIKDKSLVCFVQKEPIVTEIIDLNLNKSDEMIKKDEHQEVLNESSNNANQLSEHVTNCNEIRSSFNEYYPEHSGCNDSSSIETTSIQENLVAAIPSESAAVEPQEMACVPEMLPENNSLDSTFTSPVKNKNPPSEAVVSKDTATILQELALQRLSGGDKVDITPTRRKYDSDFTRDRRSFDSEIGREILRERKMKQELESAREKVDESTAAGHNKPNPGLPPCLRARHARATRAALSRSLDEAKFNKMTNVTDGSNSGSDYLSRINQNKSDISVRQQQHGSTPNVGSTGKSKLIGGADAQQQHSFEKSTQSLNKHLGLNLDDPRSRERIEKYKEERRTFFRDKYRSESFRAEGGDVKPEKEDEEQALLARLKQRASRPSVI